MAKKFLVCAFSLGMHQAKRTPFCWYFSVFAALKPKSVNAISNCNKAFY
jgi:hypothetical protein